MANWGKRRDQVGKEQREIGLLGVCSQLTKALSDELWGWDFILQSDSIMIQLLCYTFSFPGVKVACFPPTPLPLIDFLYISTEESQRNWV